MVPDETEIKLLLEFLEDIRNSNDVKELSRNVILYERQLAICKTQIDGWGGKEADGLESLLYFYQARVIIESEGIIEGVSRDTARKGDIVSKVAYGSIARGREKSRYRQAVLLLDQAIALFDDPDYRFSRAELNAELGSKQVALADLDHVLATYNTDSDYYMSALRIKREMESKSDKRFFIDKTLLIIIIVMVVLLLLCCCVAIAAWILWNNSDDILYELGLNLLPTLIN